MSGLQYLGIAYLLTWVVISAYLFSLMRKQREIERRLDSQGKSDSDR